MVEIYVALMPGDYLRLILVETLNPIIYIYIYIYKLNIRLHLNDQLKLDGNIGVYIAL